MNAFRWWLFRRLSELGWWICPEPHKSVLQASMSFDKTMWEGPADDVTSVVTNTLTAAGYRIIGPGEQTVTTEMVEAAQRIRDVAMQQTVIARLPECGEFGAIAQDADWLVDALKAAMEARE